MSNAEDSQDDVTPATPATQLPRGMQRSDASGKPILDAMSGRASLFGYGFAPLQEAFRMAALSCVGDAAAMIDADVDDDSDDARPDGLIAEADRENLKQRLDAVFSADSGIVADRVLLRPSADAAVDTAIALARRYHPEKSFRTIAMVGSDHGRTGMCRSASGRPELHDGFGPMMAGFSHVPPGDLDALQAVVDDQTACVLLSPIDFSRAAIACEEDYLVAIREICDQRDLLLVIDETQLVFGASGEPTTFRSIADIQADIAVFSAGLFAGLPGGLIVASSKVMSSPMIDVDRFPIHAAVLSQTLAEMTHQGLPQSSSEATHALTVAIAKTLSGFEFIRDIHATGMTIGVETDLDSREMIGAAHRHGLHLAGAGSNSIRLQPPLVISEEDQQGLLDRLGQTMESLERESAELTI